MVHEIGHVVIFIESSWSQFVGLSLSEVLDETDPDNRFIISPTVVQVARDHFNCPTLTGGPLEANSDHWDERLMETENLGPLLLDAEQYVSIFTFALMEDSGWYFVDYEYAKPLNGVKLLYFYIYR